MSPPGSNNPPLPPERFPGEILAWSETQLPRTPAGAPAIAFWRPKGRAVAIGVSQSSETDIVPDTILADGVALVRRPSGGGSVVLCEGVLCWEAWADLEDVKRLASAAGCADENGGGIRAAYAVLSIPTIHGLRALNVEAFQAGICDIAAHAKGSEDAPRKLAGTAQLRRKGKALVHGSLLVHADLSLLRRYLPQPSQAPDYRAERSHDAFCANAAGLMPNAPQNNDEAMSSVAGAIAEAATTFGWDVVIPPEELPPEAEKLTKEKYLSANWNWRKIRPAE